MQNNKNNKFTIGEFTFDTFHEYRDGMEDVKKIECIKEELDIQDPEVAVRLYNMIRNGEIAFKSPIGEQFFAHIGDIVAEKSVGLLEDKAVVEKAESQVKCQKVMGMICISLAVLCAGFFAVAEVKDIITTKKIQKLQSEKKNEITVADDSEDNDEALDNPDEQLLNESTMTILPEYQSLYEQNSDMVGWLSIPGTEVDYPVVQQKEYSDYYLQHSFDGAEDSNGTLFVDYRSGIVNESSNTIIYGHNMRSGKMFGSLKSYLDHDFYLSHKTITFNTIYEKRSYEIIAVGLSEVGYQDDEEHKYYNFIDVSNEAQLKTFLEKIQSLSVYNDEITVSKEDKLLTLSTCNSYTEDGRLFIVAKRVK